VTRRRGGEPAHQKRGGAVGEETLLAPNHREPDSPLGTRELDELEGTAFPQAPGHGLSDKGEVKRAMADYLRLQGRHGEVRSYLDEAKRLLPGDQ
jgi:hypothetical protein